MYLKLISSIPYKIGPKVTMFSKGETEDSFMLEAGHDY